MAGWRLYLEAHHKLAHAGPASAGSSIDKQRMECHGGGVELLAWAHESLGRCSKPT